jgi:hypothetical protein
VGEGGGRLGGWFREPANLILISLNFNIGGDVLSWMEKKRNAHKILVNSLGILRISWEYNIKTNLS